MSKVAILLATYNGCKFLPAQLLSIQNQTYKDWCLYVLDDGSSDNTLEILKQFNEYFGNSKFHIISQSNKGCTAAFLTLICNREIMADYYAYCDHDDIWEPEKLARAVSILEEKNQAIPQLYCSSAKLIDAAGKSIGHSIVYKKKPCFQNALVQNVASGNTMVFNNQTRALISSVGVVKIPIHDWWTYILVSACGGEVYYDKISFIQYRQHAQNLIGYSRSSLSRIFKKNGYKFYEWSRVHIEYLQAIKDKLPVNSKETLAMFEKSICSNSLSRLYWLYKSGVFRLTFFGTIKLYLVFLLKNMIT